MITNAWIARLSKIVDASGRSWREISKSAGLGSSYLSQLLCNQTPRRIHRDKLKEILRVLNVNEEAFFAEMNSEIPNWFWSDNNDSGLPDWQIVDLSVKSIDSRPGRVNLPTAHDQPLTTELKPQSLLRP